MAKCVLDVGNCGPDHSSISRMLKQQFSVDVRQADKASDALEILRSQKMDLVLVNRKLDCDYSDGLDVIKAIKSEPAFEAIPIMLVTNHDNYQQEAIAAGAVYGFGKLELQSPATHEKLAPFLQ